MNILMVTNTYTPHVGGVARSVSSFVAEYRRRGHRVLVLAPEYDDLPADDEDVIRVPAIRNFNGSNFSLPVPIPGLLATALADVPPEIIHSHHPFLLGDTALRTAASYNVPVVFTHHTLYDQYTHYLGGESPRLQRIASDIATGYCNLCQGVIAPSESVASMLVEHGVETPISVIPTGVQPERFARGDRKQMRSELRIPGRGYVIGHVGRLAQEKNLHFLTAAVAEFLKQNSDAYFIAVGAGPIEDAMRQQLQDSDVFERVRFTGVLQGDRLASAYRAMDVFAFASHSETQGMVLTEAMAAQVPVVAVDAPGVRDVLRDGKNGRMIATDSLAEFVAALDWPRRQKGPARRRLNAALRSTVHDFSLSHCAERAIAFYEHLREQARPAEPPEDSAWLAALRWIEEEWKIMAHHAKAISGALFSPLSSEAA